MINSKIINGRQLREIQFKYALFPQKSGLLRTPDVEFRGYYLTRSRRSADVFDDVFEIAAKFIFFFVTQRKIGKLGEVINFLACNIHLGQLYHFCGGCSTLDFS